MSDPKIAAKASAPAVSRADVQVPGKSDARAACRRGDAGFATNGGQWMATRYDPAATVSARRQIDANFIVVCG